MPHLHPYPVYRFPDPPRPAKYSLSVLLLPAARPRFAASRELLHLEWNGNVYKLTVGEYDAGVGRSPVRLRVTRDGAETAEYSL